MASSPRTHLPRTAGVLWLPALGGGRGHPRSPHPRRRSGSLLDILPWSHTIFSNLKAWILGTFRGVSKKHMPRYLDEFSYRFNRRWRETELFGFVLNRSVHGEPFLYSRLTAELFGYAGGR